MRSRDRSGEKPDRATVCLQIMTSQLVVAQGGSMQMLTNEIAPMTGHVDARKAQVQKMKQDFGR